MYGTFLKSLTAKQWKRIGVKRRAGVCTPLFSIYSEKSIGIGEIPDLKLLINWTKACGMSLIQLLPMNDTGFNFRPYDAESSFALDPMYLSLGELAGVNLKPFAKDIEALRRRFPLKGLWVDTTVKRAKLELLQKIFRSDDMKKVPAFKVFTKKNRSWLGSYALFKVMKEKNGLKSWEEWAEKNFDDKDEDKLRFHEWLQWQLFEQFTAVKAYADKKDVRLVGDLPFLVSRDSADVWAEPEIFKLDRASGAPPDLYFARGQRWGMPPYDWAHVERTGYAYLREKLKYAENFYDLFRIDHFVGLFRLWTIALDEPTENAGAHGVFDPSDESRWEEHGKKILSEMVLATRMLPLAEDLGVVPTCSGPTLESFAVPGMEIQRWVKNWGTDHRFKAPEEYRPNSVTMLSTHDMSALRGWWEHEAGTVDEVDFRKKCQAYGRDADATRALLFDIERSGRGRLRWKSDIRELPVLLDRLGLREADAKGFVDMYLNSFDERRQYWNAIGLKGAAKDVFTAEFAAAALAHAGKSASIFAVQLLQDWLSLVSVKELASPDCRINVPGTMDEKNWRFRLPFSLEEMARLGVDKKIRKINELTKRN